MQNPTTKSDEAPSADPLARFKEAQREGWAHFAPLEALTTPPAAELVRRAIRSGGLDELAAVLDAIRASGALEYARAQAQAESRTACAALDALPRSNYRDYLLQLADFAVTRTF